MYVFLTASFTALILGSIGVLIKRLKMPLGMAWYKFLIKFALVADAILNSISAFVLVFISDQAYADCGVGLQVVCVLYGLISIAIAVLEFRVRRKLAGYESDAPKFVKGFFLVRVCIPFLYANIASLIVEQALVENAIVWLIICLVFLFANIKYFNKRSHLFDGKTAHSESF